MIEDSIALIKEFEDLKKFPTKNKIGLLRIGYDHPLSLTSREANFLLREDVTRILKFLDEEGIPPNPGLVSLIHQIGIITFNRSRLKKALLEKNSKSIREFFVAWSKINGVTDPELLSRRLKELTYFDKEIVGEITKGV